MNYETVGYNSTPTATTAAATTPTATTTATPTPTAATTAATKAPTPATTPTAATTSVTSTASIASTTTTPAATATTLATLALTAAALPTKSRSSPDILSTKDVNSSSRSVGGGKGGGGTPFKEGCARSAMSSTYTDYTSLSCKEVILEQVDSEYRPSCAPPSWPRATPFLPARRPTRCALPFLPARRSALPACCPAGRRPALPCLRAALLAAALPCQLHRPALALFPELSAIATFDDLTTHLRTSDTRYRAALTAEFLDTNPPPMYITLYFIVTRIPDSLRAVRDHFLALDPIDLTVDLLEQHLLSAETSVVAVGVARGTPRTPFFEGCSHSPLAPSYASAAAVEVLGTEDVRAASAPSGKRRSGKGKGGKSGGGGSGGGGGGGSGAVEVAEVAVRVVAGVGVSEAAVVAVVGVVVAVVAVVGVVAAAVVAVRVELLRGEVLAVARGSSNSVRARPLRLSSFVSGFLSVGRLGVVFTPCSPT
ncbi:unnamed protein product [Closterium sp. NIES-54]